MILRTVIVLALVALVLLAFMPRVDPGRRQADMQRRASALRIALRQTLFGAAAVLLAGASAFGAWHWLRHGDHVAAVLAAAALPAALGLAWMSWRSGRQVR